MQASAHLQSGLSSEENLGRLATYRTPYTLDWINIPNQRMPSAGLSADFVKAICVLAVGVLIYRATHNTAAGVLIGAAVIPIVWIAIDLKITSLYQQTKRQQELHKINQIYQQIANNIEGKTRLKEAALTDGFNNLNLSIEHHTQKAAEEKLQYLANEYDCRAEHNDFVKRINNIGEMFEGLKNIPSPAYSNITNACDRYLKAPFLQVYGESGTWQIK